MSIRFNKTRFFLFANSYSGSKVAFALNEKYKGGKLLKIINRISVVMNFNQSHIKNFVLTGNKPPQPYLRIPSSLRIYLEVEKELLKLSEERLDEYSTTIEDYQRQLFLPAIERAIGNLLTDVKNDERFQKLLEEKLKSTYYLYYKVVDKYSLPTMRVIPFLLRIIR